ncbi:MAG: zincin-like metallopeptidase domain-containing protein [Alphaproteobacteria bacterium]|nr:zincin-like metallopeptidase domain-containing protein [Alphaproteobacteria bacterium]
MTGAASSLTLHDSVTNRIVHELEQGRFPWTQPWASATPTPLGLPQNASTGRSYSGINILLLWEAAMEQNRTSQRWLTFKQALSVGGAVRKGEKGTMVVYADTYIPGAEREKAAASGDDPRRVGFLKRFSVFHVDQCDSLPFEAVGVPIPGRTEIIPHAEAVIAATGADIRIGGDMAYYAPGPDFIQLPPQEAYFEPINWYRTKLHELGHWTGHVSRLSRDFTGRREGAAYAREELVAELCAAFLCAELGIVPTVRHADYLGAWLDILKADNRAIFQAASLASKAAEFVMGRQAR